jgi:hypothetical protein
MENDNAYRCADLLRDKQHASKGEEPVLRRAKGQLINVLHRFQFNWPVQAANMVQQYLTGMPKTG